MSGPSNSSKVLVAAAFQPSSLFFLLGGLGLALPAAWYSIWLGLFVAGFGAGLFGLRVQRLRLDPNFARLSLAAGDSTRRVLPASKRLQVLRHFSKLPPAYMEKVCLLEELGSELSDRLEEKSQGPLQKYFREAKGELDEALNQAADLAVRGGEAVGKGGGSEAILEELDRVLEVLRRAQGEIPQLDATASYEEGSLPQRLEELGSEILLLEESVKESEGLG